MRWDRQAERGSVCVREEEREIKRLQRRDVMHDRCLQKDCLCGWPFQKTHINAKQMSCK